MAWEREYHHINLDASEHVISLIEKGVVTRKGEPARYLIHIILGSDSFEYALTKKSMTIKLGGPLTIHPDGTLQGEDGTVFDPREIERKMIDRLNTHHAALRTYAKKHGVPEYKGPPKK
jgi:hypothetical protein